MKTRLYLFAAGLLALGLACLLNQGSITMAANAQEPLLVHNVYFSLNDNSPANIQKLVAACNKYLTDHPGTVLYACGTVSDLDRSVNDRDWDVGLHVVFKNRAAHDTYQTAPRHLQFIEENKATWKKVRVFDSDCATAAKG
jgi:hypothetical protein